MSDTNDIEVARLVRQMRESCADIAGHTVTPSDVAQKMLESLSEWMEDQGVQDMPDIEVTFDPDSPCDMVVHIPIVVSAIELSASVDVDDDEGLGLPPGRYVFDDETGEFVPAN